MPGIDLLERLRSSGLRERTEVLEHEPPRELVASADIARPDPLGRTVVACPAGQPPAHWLTLTKAERDSLIEPPPPPPDGTLEPGHCGFSPRNVRLGFGIENG
jgi:hypothetical protein